MILVLELTEAQYAWLESLLNFRAVWQRDPTRESVDAQDILYALRDAHTEALRKELA